METELTPKQQASEAIRQARTILVATGAHPSTDQIAAVIALTSILRKFDKKVTAIISDAIPSNLNFLSGETLDRTLTGQRDFILKVDLGKAEVDSLKYTIEDGKLNVHITPFKGGFAPSDVTFAYGSYKYDLAIVIGVATRARLDRIFTDNPQIMAEVPLVNFDFHRSNENYGAINLIDGNAASLCEMLIALSESLQTGLIDEPIATALLTGIIASTDRFTATHTTAKSLTVAAQMMAAGAKQQLIVQNLYRNGGSNDRPERRNDNNRGPRDGQGGGNAGGGQSGNNAGGNRADDRSRNQPANNPAPKPEEPKSPEPKVEEPKVEAPRAAEPVAPQLPPNPVEQIPAPEQTHAPETFEEVAQIPTPTPDNDPSAVMPIPAPEGQLVEDAPTTVEVNPANAFLNDPELYFQGEGSVLANLPEVQTVQATPVNDPYTDPSVLAFNQIVQHPAAA